jgi:hypothetical protein
MKMVVNKEELYYKVSVMVPVSAKEDFRQNVRDNLKNYVNQVKQLDDADKPDTWDALLSRLDQLCDAINRAIDNEYKGLRHSAYSAIKNQLDGYKTKSSKIDGLAYDKNILTLPVGSISYRMRIVPLEEQKRLTEKDLFHIPLNKRTLVTTQRYSVPGYPCLYLAKRVYGCWEEMGRCVFGTSMVSAVRTTNDIKLIDLRVPTKQTWLNDFERCVLFFPLVLATMVQVKKDSDPYKPEYTIPQILTEWVIAHNREQKDVNQKIIGIVYTSAQKNEDFDYPEDSYENYAIPVIYPLSNKKYCRGLASYFELTKPTYFDLEILRNGIGLDMGEIGLSEDEQKEENIRTSYFGKMEEFINKYKFSKIVE